MKPKIIIHNQVSLDGALTGFPINMEKHYEISGRFKPDAMLVGSITVVAGFELFQVEIPEEEDSDFIKPEPEVADKRPYWIIPDTTARLVNKLHVLRRAGYCKDVIVLISEKTPEAYKDYLNARGYKYIQSGLEKVDLENVIGELANLYSFQTIVTDCGALLNGILLKKRIADELSLLIAPVLAGKSSLQIFSHVEQLYHLEIKETRIMEDGLMWLWYKIIYN